jgi:hypothetical protein
MNQEVVNRFWRFVGNTDENECWLWTGSLSSHFGQARFSYKNKTLLAYRVSYEIHKGTIPDGKIIRHMCDNAWCVNPEHLEIGTQQDNIRDMIERGRAIYPPKRKGEEHAGAKLTQQQVHEIRSSTLTGVELAKQYNVSRALISRIKNKKIWT